MSASSSSSSSHIKSALAKVNKAGSAVRALAAGGQSNHPNAGGGSGGTGLVGGLTGSSSTAGIVHGQVLNCYRTVHEYISKMVASVPGLKALLLDSETIQMVGLIYSQSDLVAKEVFLVESINVIADGMVEEKAEEEEFKKKLRKGLIMKTDKVGINEQSMQHLKAIVFMQPTSLSLDKLGILLKSPRYREYHIFFSNILPSGYLEALADLDIYESIKEVHEYYADYYVVTPSLFHFNADSVQAERALRTSNVYSSKQSWLYDRDFQGLLSVFLSLKKRPDIRYMAGSDICKKLGYDLVNEMKNEQDLFHFGGEPTLLLLMDRREDVVTPLLTQWTYQSMVHELLGIKLNQVILPDRSPSGQRIPPTQSTTTAGPKTQAQKDHDVKHQVILSSESDEWFKSTMFVNFGELGIRVKALVANFRNLTHVKTNMDTLSDMTKVLENYPQFKLQSATVVRHFSVMEEISKLVNERRLLAVSAVEQEIVCGPASEHQETYEKLAKLMEDQNVQFYDKLRCTLLYALRYSQMPNNLPQLRGLLRAHARMSSNYNDSILQVIDRMLDISQGHTRTWPLFQQDSDELTFKNVVRQIQTNVKGVVENMYTQHKSLLYEVLTNLFAGELKTMQFPFVEAPNKTVYRRVIVYVVGGCTYEEYAQVENLMAHPRYKGNFTTILGGSTIHNSNSFLQEVVNLDGYQKNPNDTSTPGADDNEDFTAHNVPSGGSHGSIPPTNLSRSTSQPQRPNSSHLPSRTMDDIRINMPASSPAHQHPSLDRSTTPTGTRSGNFTSTSSSSTASNATAQRLSQLERQLPSNPSLTVGGAPRSRPSPGGAPGSAGGNRPTSGNLNRPNYKPPASSSSSTASAAPTHRPPPRNSTGSLGLGD